MNSLIRNVKSIKIPALQTIARQATPSLSSIESSRCSSPEYRSRSLPPLDRPSISPFRTFSTLSSLNFNTNDALSEAKSAKAPTLKILTKFRRSLTQRHVKKEIKKPKKGAVRDNKCEAPCVKPCNDRVKKSREHDLGSKRSFHNYRFLDSSSYNKTPYYQYLSKDREFSLMSSTFQGINRRNDDPGNIRDILKLNEALNEVKKKKKVIENRCKNKINYFYLEESNRADCKQCSSKGKKRMGEFYKKNSSKLSDNTFKPQNRSYGTRSLNQRNFQQNRAGRIHLNEEVARSSKYGEETDEKPIIQVQDQNLESKSEQALTLFSLIKSRTAKKNACNETVNKYKFEPKKRPDIYEFDPEPIIGSSNEKKSYAKEIARKIIPTLTRNSNQNQRLTEILKRNSSSPLLERKLASKEVIENFSNVYSFNTKGTCSCPILMKRVMNEETSPDHKKWAPKLSHEKVQLHAERCKLDQLILKESQRLAPLPNVKEVARKETKKADEKEIFFIHHKDDLNNKINNAFAKVPKVELGEQSKEKLAQAIRNMIQPVIQKEVLKHDEVKSALQRMEKHLELCLEKLNLPERKPIGGISKYDLNWVTKKEREKIQDININPEMKEPYVKRSKTEDPIKRNPLTVPNNSKVEIFNDPLSERNVLITLEDENHTKYDPCTKQNKNKDYLRKKWGTGGDNGGSSGKQNSKPRNEDALKGSRTFFSKKSTVEPHKDCKNSKPDSRSEFPMAENICKIGKVPSKLQDVSDIKTKEVIKPKCKMEVDPCKKDEPPCSPVKDYIIPFDTKGSCCCTPRDSCSKGKEDDMCPSIKKPCFKVNDPEKRLDYCRGPSCNEPKKTSSAGDEKKCPPSKRASAKDNLVNLLFSGKKKKQNPRDKYEKKRMPCKVPVPEKPCDDKCNPAPKKPPCTKKDPCKLAPEEDTPLMKLFDKEEQEVPQSPKMEYDGINFKEEQSVDFHGSEVMEKNHIFSNRPDRSDCPKKKTNTPCQDKVKRQQDEGACVEKPPNTPCKEDPCKGKKKRPKRLSEEESEQLYLFEKEKKESFQYFANDPDRSDCPKKKRKIPCREILKFPKVKEPCSPAKKSPCKEDPCKGRIKKKASEADNVSLFEKESLGGQGEAKDPRSYLAPNEPDRSDCPRRKKIVPCKERLKFPKKDEPCGPAKKPPCKKDPCKDKKWASEENLKADDWFLFEKNSNFEASKTKKMDKIIPEPPKILGDKNDSCKMSDDSRGCQKGCMDNVCRKPPCYDDGTHISPKEMECEKSERPSLRGNSRFGVTESTSAYCRRSKIQPDEAPTVEHPQCLQKPCNEFSKTNSCGSEKRGEAGTCSKRAVDRGFAGMKEACHLDFTTQDPCPDCGNQYAKNVEAAKDAYLKLSQADLTRAELDQAESEAEKADLALKMNRRDPNRNENDRRYCDEEIIQMRKDELTKLEGKCQENKKSEQPFDCNRPTKFEGPTKSSWNPVTIESRKMEDSKTLQPKSKSKTGLNTKSDPVLKTYEAKTKEKRIKASVTTAQGSKTIMETVSDLCMLIIRKGNGGKKAAPIVVTLVRSEPNFYAFGAPCSGIGLMGSGGSGNGKRGKGPYDIKRASLFGWGKNKSKTKDKKKDKYPWTDKDVCMSKKPTIKKTKDDCKSKDNKEYLKDKKDPYVCVKDKKSKGGADGKKKDDCKSKDKEDVNDKKDPYVCVKDKKGRDSNKSADGKGNDSCKPKQDAEVCKDLDKAIAGKRSEDCKQKPKEDPCKSENPLGDKAQKIIERKKQSCKDVYPPPKKEDPCKKKEDPCKKKEDKCKKNDDKKEDKHEGVDEYVKKRQDPCKPEDPCKKTEDDFCKKKCIDPSAGFSKKIEDPKLKTSYQLARDRSFCSDAKKKDTCEKNKKNDFCAKVNNDRAKQDKSCTHFSDMGVCFQTPAQITDNAVIPACEKVDRSFKTPAQVVDEAAKCQIIKADKSKLKNRYPWNGPCKGRLQKKSCLISKASEAPPDAKTCIEVNSFESSKEPRTKVLECPKKTPECGARQQNASASGYCKQDPDVCRKTREAFKKKKGEQSTKDSVKKCMEQAMQKSKKNDGCKDETQGSLPKKASTDPKKPPMVCCSVSKEADKGKVDCTEVFSKDDEIIEKRLPTRNENAENISKTPLPLVQHLNKSNESGFKTDIQNKENETSEDQDLDEILIINYKPAPTQLNKRPLSVEEKPKESPVINLNKNSINIDNNADESKEVHQHASIEEELEKSLHSHSQNSIKPEKTKLKKDVEEKSNLKTHDNQKISKNQSDLQNINDYKKMTAKDQDTYEKAKEVQKQRKERVEQLFSRLELTSAELDRKIRLDKEKYSILPRQPQFKASDMLAQKTSPLDVRNDENFDQTALEFYTKYLKMLDTSKNPAQVPVQSKTNAVDIVSQNLNKKSCVKIENQDEKFDNEAIECYLEYFKMLSESKNADRLPTQSQTTVSEVVFENTKQNPLNIVESDLKIDHSTMVFYAEYYKMLNNHKNVHQLPAEPNHSASDILTQVFKEKSMMLPSEEQDTISLSQELTQDLEETNENQSVVENKFSLHEQVLNIRYQGIKDENPVSIKNTNLFFKGQYEVINFHDMNSELCENKQEDSEKEYEVIHFVKDDLSSNLVGEEVYTLKVSAQDDSNLIDPTLKDDQFEMFNKKDSNLPKKQNEYAFYKSERFEKNVEVLKETPFDAEIRADNFRAGSKVFKKEGSIVKEPLEEKTFKEMLFRPSEEINLQKEHKFVGEVFESFPYIKPSGIEVIMSEVYKKPPFEVNPNDNNNVLEEYIESTSFMDNMLPKSIHEVIYPVHKNSQDLEGMNVSKIDMTKDILKAYKKSQSFSYDVSENLTEMSEIQQSLNEFLSKTYKAQETDPAIKEMSAVPKELSNVLPYIYQKPQYDVTMTKNFMLSKETSNLERKAFEEISQIFQIQKTLSQFLNDSFKKSEMKDDPSKKDKENSCYKKDPYVCVTGEKGSKNGQQIEASTKKQPDSCDKDRKDRKKEPCVPCKHENYSDRYKKKDDCGKSQKKKDPCKKKCDQMQSQKSISLASFKTGFRSPKDGKKEPCDLCKHENYSDRDQMQSRKSVSLTSFKTGFRSPKENFKQRSQSCDDVPKKFAAKKRKETAGKTGESERVNKEFSLEEKCTKVEEFIKSRARKHRPEPKTEFKTPAQIVDSSTVKKFELPKELCYKAPPKITKSFCTMKEKAEKAKIATLQAAKADPCKKDQSIQKICLDGIKRKPGENKKPSGEEYDLAKAIEDSFKRKSNIKNVMKNYVCEQRPNRASSETKIQSATAVEKEISNQNLIDQTLALLKQNLIKIKQRNTEDCNKRLAQRKSARTIKNAAEDANSVQKSSHSEAKSTKTKPVAYVPPQEKSAEKRTVEKGESAKEKSGDYPKKVGGKSEKSGTFKLFDSKSGYGKPSSANKASKSNDKPFEEKRASLKSEEKPVDDKKSKDTLAVNQNISSKSSKTIKNALKKEKEQPTGHRNPNPFKVEKKVEGGDHRIKKDRQVVEQKSSTSKTAEVKFDSKTVPKYDVNQKKDEFEIYQKKCGSTKIISTVASPFLKLDDSSPDQAGGHSEIEEALKKINECMKNRKSKESDVWPKKIVDKNKEKSTSNSSHKKCGSTEIISTVANPFFKLNDSSPDQTGGHSDIEEALKKINECMKNRKTKESDVWPKKIVDKNKEKSTSNSSHKKCGSTEIISTVANPFFKLNDSSPDQTGGHSDIEEALKKINECMKNRKSKESDVWPKKIVDKNKEKSTSNSSQKKCGSTEIISTVANPFLKLDDLSPDQSGGHSEIEEALKKINECMKNRKSKESDVWPKKIVDKNKEKSPRNGEPKKCHSSKNNFVVMDQELKRINQIMRKRFLPENKVPGSENRQHFENDLFEQDLMKVNKLMQLRCRRDVDFWYRHNVARKGKERRAGFTQLRQKFYDVSERVSYKEIELRELKQINKKEEKPCYLETKPKKSTTILSLCDKIKNKEISKKHSTKGKSKISCLARPYGTELLLSKKSNHRPLHGVRHKSTASDDGCSLKYKVGNANELFKCLKNQAKNKPKEEICNLQKKSVQEDLKLQKKENESVCPKPKQAPKKSCVKPKQEPKKSCGKKKADKSQYPSHEEKKRDICKHASEKRSREKQKVGEPFPTHIERESICKFNGIKNEPCHKEIKKSPSKDISKENKKINHTCQETSENKPSDVYLSGKKEAAFYKDNASAKSTTCLDGKNRVDFCKAQEFSCDPKKAVLIRAQVLIDPEKFNTEVEKVNCQMKNNRKDSLSLVKETDQNAKMECPEKCQNKTGYQLGPHASKDPDFCGCPNSNCDCFASELLPPTTNKVEKGKDLGIQKSCMKKAKSPKELEMEKLKERRRRLEEKDQGLLRQSSLMAKKLAENKDEIEVISGKEEKKPQFGEKLVCQVMHMGAGEKLVCTPDDSSEPKSYLNCTNLCQNNDSNTSVYEDADEGVIKVLDCTIEKDEFGNEILLCRALRVPEGVKSETDLMKFVQNSSSRERLAKVTSNKLVCREVPVKIQGKECLNEDGTTKKEMLCQIWKVEEIRKEKEFPDCSAPKIKRKPQKSSLDELTKKIRIQTKNCENFKDQK